MARYARIQVKQLKELQAAIKRGESAVDYDQVKPILADAVDLIRVEAVNNLQSIGLHLGGKLPLQKKYPDAMHVEDVLRTEEGKSSHVASAWTKVMKKFAPQAWWLEYGHVLWKGASRRYQIGRQVGQIQPRPFFRPAVVSKRTAVRRAIRVGLQTLLAKAWGFGKPGDAQDNG